MYRTYYHTNFNSTIVQLIVLLNVELLYRFRYFNSTIVQLIAVSSRDELDIKIFQFYYSSINRQYENCEFT